MRPPTHVTARYRPPARGSRCAVAVRGARMYDTLQGARGRWRLAAGHGPCTAAHGLAGPAAARLAVVARAAYASCALSVSLHTPHSHSGLADSLPASRTHLRTRHK